FGYTTDTVVSCQTKLNLLASFGALASELFGVASIVDVAILFEAGDNFLDEVFIGGAADESLFHFGDGMRAAREDFDCGVVQSGFGFELAGLGEHAGSIEEKVASG